MPILKSSRLCSQEHFESSPSIISDYFEVITKRVLDASGAVKVVQERVSMPHPTSDLDANHFRIDVVLETDPTQLQRVDYLITDNFKVLDNLSNFNTSLNEKSSI